MQASFELMPNLLVIEKTVSVGGGLFSSSTYSIE